MKNKFSISILLAIFILNYSCAQDLKPLDQEDKNSIITSEDNYEMELVFDDETIILKEGDTITVAPNVWHEAKCMDGGKMLTIFKNGQFDIFLECLTSF